MANPKNKPPRIEEEDVLQDQQEALEGELLQPETSKLPQPIPTLSDKELEKIGNERERNMRAFWAKEKKVSIIVPFNPGEENIKPAPEAYANINGVEVRFPKNEYQELPESVAQIFMDSMNQTNKAVNQFRINGNDDKEKALL